MSFAIEEGMRCLRNNVRRGQTAVEYVMLLAVMMIPLAVAVRGLLEDSGDGKNDNKVRLIVRDAYGDEKRMGMIGRPYP